MLVSTKDLLETAQRHGYAVGAFNMYNFEGVEAVVRAAEQLQSPAMLQMHPKVLSYGKQPLVALFLEAARSASVPIAVHLDHSSDRNDIRMALEAGMNSVLADGSHHPYQENLTFTREMTQLAHSYGAAVEAEIGRISGTEDGLTVSEKEAKMTDPQQAGEFVRATQVDCLAVTIGNVHGKYRSEPHLDFDRLQKIRDAVSLPLVLHGASGLPAEMIARSIELGVCKFNVNTEVRQAYMDVLRSLSEQPEADLTDTMEEAMAAMEAVIAAKMRLFGSDGKAKLHAQASTPAAAT
ncbi:class II fructose-bisphosphate aldolase [Geitlerinema sp. PCC 9228]|jgi:tagatose 1,6-diphosphate aldolase GatY/KbaY|uniref:class II fructose-bisphosphate aldolase n=1 Tax=Geitlerinema sp. PCC 9228 TaxID=111611 RepID=UPI0008F9C310|nr:class II fructose-bisphosphate aldolase [Geitlerinema sp. PCC 9228]